MMNKKWTPHIITEVSLVVLIVLGLACASAPKEAPLRETGGPVSLDRAIQMAARSIEDNVEEDNVEKDLKIALLNFRSPTEQFSEYVIEELTSQLVHGKKLIVVDRRELDLIRREEEFQLSDDVSDASAQAIGKKLGAQLIVSGSINAVGNVYRIRIRALYVETAAIAASPAADISAAEERVAFLLDGKGPIQVNTNSPQVPARASSENRNRVYIAGAYGNNGDTACYWVDGARTDLPGLSGSAATGIAVSGGKVYTAGYYVRSGWIACYWADGVRIDLPVPTVDDSKALAVAVSDGKVYAAGYYGGEGPTPCYWVDGIRTDLPIPNINHGFITANYAEAIAVSGGKVYAAGYYGSLGGPSRNSTACYWVDGVRTDLPVPSGLFGSAAGIAVSGGRVYAAGTYSRNLNEAAGTACYWVDGVRTDLPGSFGRTADITVSDGKVYVAGSYGRSGTSGRIACYWIDGVRTDLHSPNSAETSAIAVSGGKVYAAGYYGGWGYNRTGGTACYWIDGVRTDLNPYGAGSFAIAVEVGR